MPRSPRFRNDQFDVRVTAHTDPGAGFALNAWSLELAWATGTLALVSFSSSSLFAAPTTKRDDTAGTLRVAAVGTRASTAPSDVSGTAVPLLTVRFRVLGTATHDHTHDNMLGLTALELLNQGSYRFVENAAAQINDARGGVQTAGQLTVERVLSAGRLQTTAAA